MGAEVGKAEAEAWAERKRQVGLCAIGLIWLAAVVLFLWDFGAIWRMEFLAYIPVLISMALLVVLAGAALWLAVDRWRVGAVVVLGMGLLGTLWFMAVWHKFSEPESVRPGLTLFAGCLIAAGLLCLYTHRSRKVFAGVLLLVALSPMLALLPGLRVENNSVVVLKGTGYPQMIVPETGEIELAVMGDSDVETYWQDLIVVDRQGKHSARSFPFPENPGNWRLLGLENSGNVIVAQIPLAVTPLPFWERVVVDSDGNASSEVSGRISMLPRGRPFFSPSGRFLLFSESVPKEVSAIGDAPLVPADMTMADMWGGPDARTMADLEEWTVLLDGVSGAEHRYLNLDTGTEVDWQDETRVAGVGRIAPKDYNDGRLMFWQIDLKSGELTTATLENLGARSSAVSTPRMTLVVTYREEKGEQHLLLHETQEVRPLPPPPSIGVIGSFHLKSERQIAYEYFRESPNPMEGRTLHVITDGVETYREDIPYGIYTNSLAISPDGKFLMAGFVSMRSYESVPFSWIRMSPVNVEVIDMQTGRRRHVVTFGEDDQLNMSKSVPRSGVHWGRDSRTIYALNFPFPRPGSTMAGNFEVRKHVLGE